MAESMTGYGRGEATLDQRSLSVEIRTVNSRFADVSIRQPRALNALEIPLRERLTAALQRGKIEVRIQFEEQQQDSVAVQLNHGLARAYNKALQEIASLTGESLTQAALWLAAQPNVLEISQIETEETLLAQLLDEAVGQALEQLLAMRQQEGLRLAQDLRLKLDDMEQLRQQILAQAPRVVESYRARLNARLAQLLGGLEIAIDEQRLAMEVALFADKCAIDEELVRLASHLEQFGQILESDGPVGKQLEFLVQEINREVNTIGSKANDLQLTEVVVQLKTLLEKIREQIQNLV